MQKQIICLYGGPGVGKSTISFDLVSSLKKKRYNVELVREYIKDWMWEKRSILEGDQYYIFTKQTRLERLQFADVDLIVTESPAWLYPIYEKKFEKPPFICDLLIQKHTQLARCSGFKYKHFFLERCNPYNPVGRYQTEEEAIKIDVEMLEYLKSSVRDVNMIKADSEAALNIIKTLNL